MVDSPGQTLFQSLSQFLTHPRSNERYTMRTTTKLIVANSLLTLLIVLALAIFVLNSFYAVELQEEHDDLEKCINTFWAILGHKGTEFRLEDGRLLVGNHVLNNNFETTDKVQKIFGGVATIFMGDERVSTNVLDTQGKRAVGTRLVGPAHTSIFKEGLSFRGEAPILGHVYLTAYDPIRDKNGAIIGALFVGVKKSTFQEHFNQVKSPIILMLVVLLGFVGIVAFLLLKITRKLESTEATNLNFLRTLIDTIPTPIFYKDEKGRYLGANKAYEAYVGMAQDEFVGKSPSDLWPQELAEEYQNQDQWLFENPGVQIYEGSIVTADGTQHEVIFHKATFYSRYGAVAGLVGIILDITERKCAEEETQRAYRQLNDIIEFLPDATFVVDKDKRVIAWNLAIEKMTGVAKESILGKGDYAYAEPFYGVRRPTLIDFIDKDETELRANYDYVQKNGRTIFAQVTLPALGNHDTRFVSSTASPLLDVYGNHVGSIQSIRDLTENRRESVEKSKLNAQLHHSQMMQSVMIQLGHDLKTPLTPLIALLPIITGQLSDPQLKRMVDICWGSARQINELTNKTLDFAALSSMSASVERQDILLAASVDALLARQFKGVSCENLIASDIVVLAEPHLLDEILTNLISNAVCFSPSHETVQITAEQTVEFVTVAVRDNGIGLAPQHLECIFDEFFKVDESRHDLAMSGLGLSICKKIVFNQKGKIWAESSGLGQGSTFFFTLPRNVNK